LSFGLEVALALLVLVALDLDFGSGIALDLDFGLGIALDLRFCLVVAIVRVLEIAFGIVFDLISKELPKGFGFVVDEFGLLEVQLQCMVEVLHLEMLVLVQRIRGCMKREVES